MGYGSRLRVINFYNEKAAKFGSPLVVCEGHLKDLQTRFGDLFPHLKIGNSSRIFDDIDAVIEHPCTCLLYTSPSPRDS